VSDFPHPIGTLVTCVNPIGIPLLDGCRKHVWQIISTAEPCGNESGYLQRARCVVCLTPPSPSVDAWFFHAQPDVEVVVATLTEIDRRLVLLTAAKRVLEEPGPLLVPEEWVEREKAPTMRNFDQ
jgi:hypothetical protein